MDPRCGTAHMPCMCDVNPRGSRYACQAPPDARPPLQSHTLCALVPPPIHKRGARTCHLLGQQRHILERLQVNKSCFTRYAPTSRDARQLELISPDAANSPNQTCSHKR